MNIDGLDVDRVSKRVLVRLIQEQRQTIQNLSIELFCANPHHAAFKAYSESDLAPLRVERIRRANQGGKQ